MVVVGLLGIVKLAVVYGSGVLPGSGVLSNGDIATGVVATGFAGLVVSQAKDSAHSLLSEWIPGFKGPQLQDVSEAKEIAQDDTNTASIEIILAMPTHHFHDTCPANAPPPTLHPPICYNLESSEAALNATALAAPFTSLETQSPLSTSGTISGGDTSDYTYASDSRILLAITFVVTCIFAYVSAKLVHRLSSQRTVQQTGGETTDSRLSVREVETKIAASDDDSDGCSLGEDAAPFSSLADDIFSDPPVDVAVPLPARDVVEPKELSDDQDHGQALISPTGDKELPHMDGKDPGARHPARDDEGEIARNAPLDAAEPTRALEELSMGLEDDKTPVGDEVKDRVLAQDDDGLKDVAALLEDTDPAQAGDIVAASPDATVARLSPKAGLPNEAGALLSSDTPKIAPCETTAAPELSALTRRPRQFATLPRACRSPLLHGVGALLDEDLSTADEDPSTTDKGLATDNDEDLPTHAGDPSTADGPILGVARPLLVGSSPPEFDNRPTVVFFERGEFDEEGTVQWWHVLFGACEHAELDGQQLLFQLLVLLCRAFLGAQGGACDVVVVFRMLFLEQTELRPGQCWLLVDLRRRGVGQRGLSMRQLAIEAPRLEIVLPRLEIGLPARCALLGVHGCPLLSDGTWLAGAVYQARPADAVPPVKPAQRMLLLEAAPMEGDAVGKADADGEQDADDEEVVVEEEDADNDQEDADNPEDARAQEDAGGLKNIRALEDALGQEDARDQEDIRVQEDADQGGDAGGGQDAADDEGAANEEDVDDQAEIAPLQGQIAHAPMQLDEDAPAENHAGEEEAVPVRRALAPRPLRLAQRTAVAVPMQDRPNGVNRPRENRADDGVLPVHGQADAGAPLLHDRADERRLPNERVITPANSEEAVQLVATIQDVRPATVVQLRRISDVFKAVARFRLRGREGRKRVARDHDAGAGDAAAQDRQGRVDDGAGAKEGAGADDGAGPADAVNPMDAEVDVQPQRVVPDGEEALEPARNVPQQAAAVVEASSAKKTTATPLGSGTARVPLADTTNRPALQRSDTGTGSGLSAKRRPWRP